jgi:cytochrome d ubiquinol oxidase subunit I
MEGLFQSEPGAPLAILGQPDMEKRRLDNPINIPYALSFLTYRVWTAEVKGLDAFPKNEESDNIPLLYFSYHIMVGLGTIFVAILLLAAFKLFRGTLYTSRATLWILMLAFPFSSPTQPAGSRRKLAASRG